MNLTPGQYRNVSVASVPVGLDADSLRAYFLGRQAYRRTRYIVACRGDSASLIEVTRESETPLFAPISSVTQLAAPDETAFVDAPGEDTGIPTVLARVAASHAPGRRCTVVRGLYGHVSFILDPAPVRITVLEVVPPHPAKLLDQVSRVLQIAEDLPPVDIIPALTDLRDLAAQHPADHYLFPCRAGDAETGLAVSYLDEIPPRADWTLVGCARSRAIHDWFYDRSAAMVDMCPRNLASRARQAGDLAAGPVITKCCLLEDRVAVEDGLVIVPWGARLAQVLQGLGLAVEEAQAVSLATR